ncbi:hypothetical protein [Actinoplanes solisilvae]|uniref:hypothetical protein n=1 Tax=Actinoplanes solisilvae TaxID=2486853 RepID=UPI000FDA7CA5|nr:hypothetical protein [Actinoplanes solisilvae]
MRMSPKWWLVLLLLPFPLIGVIDSWQKAVAYVVLVTVVAGVSSLMRHGMLAQLEQWATVAEWTPVEATEREWPWQSPRHVKVKRAWTREIDGLSVTFGLVGWESDALAGSVRKQTGSGTFVVVRLPHTQPSMALSPSGDIVGDSPRAHQPELLQAFQRKDIRAWTVRGDELFTIEPTGLPNPYHVKRIVRRALLAVRLLDLGPDLHPGPDTTTSIAPGLDE